MFIKFILSSKSKSSISSSVSSKLYFFLVLSFFLELSSTLCGGAKVLALLSLGSYISAIFSVTSSSVSK